MPAQADITVKKADGTTDVTYNKVAPSAGDKTPALWRQNSASGIVGFRPSLAFATKPNASGDQRRAEVNFSFPVTYTDSTTGLDKLQKSVDVRATVFLPVDLSSTDWNEAFAQFAHLMSSTQIVSSVAEGYAPT